jgi:uncharacterized protein YjbI with pentapeptide repeats
MDGIPEQIIKNSVCDACAQATEGYDSKLGNDLFVEYFLFCNFYGANLENTNFVNTELWASFFVNASLPNAVLSGADLTGANLTNADLDGADLNCKNHSICN